MVASTENVDTMPASPEDHMFRLTKESSTSVAAAFKNDGFVLLQEALDPSLLEDWRNFGEAYFIKSFQLLHENGHTNAPIPYEKEYLMGLGAKNGFKEMVMRSPGRYELSLLDCLDQVPDIKKIVGALEPLLPKCLGGGYKSTLPLKLCHLSILVSTPGSTDQGWHADGGHASLQQHLPCHCANVFVPLHDLPEEMGPTEFRPESHYLTRNLAPMMLAAKCRGTLRVPVWPALNLGDVVCFDYRILHRGRANNSDRNRFVLVLTFAEPWFTDVLNFPKRSMKTPAE
ncbi:unnamed protein product [Cylindrotheca closterium]|uniref:Phytanoyl-CoA dioxygenase n=1 Tax=Cylindrotheca closterium TaxID=2856 RepID=A0AAD2CR27_9STRA|nr:unnamed protein product [Cylindrotheca closterium]